MFCSSCGKQIPDGSRFCEYCGNPVGGNVPQPDSRPAGVPEAGQIPPQYGQAPPQYSQIPPQYGQAPPQANQIPPQYGQVPPGYPQPPKKKFPIIPFVIGVVFLTALIIAGGLMLLGNDSGKGGSSAKAKKETTAAKENNSSGKQDSNASGKKDSKSSDEKKETEAVPKAEPKPAETEMVPAIKPQPAESETAFVDEYVLTQSDYEGFARRLSTTNHALALDFEWAWDYVINGNNSSFAAQDLIRVTDDMEPLINGGWKAYMFTRSGDYGSDTERYFNVEITADGSRFGLKTNWAYLLDPAAGNSIQENGSDSFKGTFDALEGTASAQSDYAKIDIDGFYISPDFEEEYAIGTFYWISGEKDCIALMREVKY